MPSPENASSTVYKPRRYLLTKNEVAFFRVLSALVDRQYLISCKVRLADIITCTDEDWRKGAANRIAQKHIDFVVSRADSSRIVAAIELDDSSHQRSDRRERDVFVNALFKDMAVRLIRVPARWRYDRETVVAILERAGLMVTNERVPSHSTAIVRNTPTPTCHRKKSRRRKDRISSTIRRATLAYYPRW